MEIEAELLKDAGFLLDRAMNGKIAVEKVEKFPAGYYDLVLMDIQMPAMKQPGLSAGWKMQERQKFRLLRFLPIFLKKIKESPWKAA